MEVVITFLKHFFVGKQETYIYNIPLLIFIIAVLLFALGVSVYISKKNRLYIKPDKKKKRIHIVNRNEAA